MPMHHANMAIMGQFTAFDPETEDWESYSMWLQFHLQVNGVTDPEMKRAAFFSFCRRETLDVAQAIPAPE